jgi:hypothetical protein
MLFDDPASLEPEEVVYWFEVCGAALAHEEQETYRLLGTEAELSPALVGALGVGASSEEIAAYFTGCREELELSAVLALTASAEARLRLDAALRMQRGQDALGKRLQVMQANARAGWMIPLYADGIVDAWKAYIASIANLVKNDRARMLTSIGRFKNLLDIRHWVAHGRYWELKWGITQFSPDVAADIVSELYTALRTAAGLEGLMSFA